MNVILSIGTHPDDIEIGCGGTEILLKQKGYRIIHVVVTSGEEGSLTIPKEHLKQQRESEAQHSAKIIGADQVIFLRYHDGLINYDKALKIRIISIIREYKPHIIFTHAVSDVFPDHQVVHQLTLAAATAAGGPWYPDTSSPPYITPFIYGYEVWNPIHKFQLAVPIQSVIKLKLQALSCHKSQIQNVNYISAVKGLAAYRGIMAMKSSYAEVFEAIRSEHLPDLIESY